MDDLNLHDYFFNIESDEHQNVAYGVLKGLFLMGIPKTLIHNCFLTNRLDELVDKKYKNRESKYYELFKQKNIKFGKTCLLPVHVDDFEIYDSDHCPSCNQPGFLTINYPHGATPDCYVCCKQGCKMCSRIDKANCSYVCLSCI